MECHMPLKAGMKLRKKLAGLSFPRQRPFLASVVLDGGPILQEIESRACRGPKIDWDKAPVEPWIDGGGSDGIVTRAGPHSWE